MRGAVDHPWDDPDGDGHNCVGCIEAGASCIPWKCDKDAHNTWVIRGKRHTRLWCHVHMHFIPGHPCALSGAGDAA